ncbi:MAG: response regulator [Balneolaceae bacterium]
MNQRIVIVEDDKILGIVLKKMAELLGYEVLAIAQTGTEAIDAVLRYTPDLIFMDVFLADDVNGIEAMQKIREKIDTPVLYITAQSEFSVREQISLIDNAYFMLKPVSLNELKVAVQGISEAA